MSTPGQTIGVSAFTDHLLAATGLPRLQLSNAYFVGTLTSGLLLPYGGVLLDRFGARMTAFFASIGLALTLCYLSFSDRLATLISNKLAIVPYSTVVLFILVLGFVCLRFSGQGMLTMTSRATIGKWFSRRRGFFSGITGVFLAFGFSIAPLTMSSLIDIFGWGTDLANYGSSCRYWYGYDRMGFLSRSPGRMRSIDGWKKRNL